jgi:tetratricopeptide (TPR) repeat protein
MKPDWRTTRVLAAVLICSLAGCVALLGPMDRVKAEAGDETLYIPSPSVVKKLSFGYTGLVADFYWTRAVQYFGGHHYRQANSYNLLYPLLDITTTLDPHLLVAYQFGSIFLSQKPPDGAGQPDKAVELVERGIRANPNDWKLYYNLGFIYYDMKAYKQASEVFTRGTKVPGANPALAALAAKTAEEGGGREAGRLLWTKLYESSDNDAIRNNALQHLIALRIEDDIPELEKLVRTFNEKTGRWPGSFEEMVAAGWLRGVPADPTGEPYKLLPEGRVDVQTPGKNPYLVLKRPSSAAASNPEEQNSAPSASDRK